MVGAFGPYVIGGIRTEQLVIYGSLALYFIPIVRSFRHWPRSLRTMLFLWAIPLGIGAVGVLFPARLPPGNISGSALAGLDNYSSPVALMAITGFWLSRGGEARALLDRAALLTAVLAAANGTIALLQFGGQQFNWLAAFWVSDGVRSVGALALQMGRFTGVFNQPAEAGLAYSLGLLSLTYLWVKGQHRQPALLIALMSAVLAGSFLSQSKMVLVLGILLVLALVGIQASRSRTAAVWFGVTTLVLSATGAFFLSNDLWLGSLRLTSLISDSVSGGVPDIGALSGERYGEGSVLREPVAFVLGSHPISGFGLGGVAFPYDSAWLEVLTISGLVGFMSYVTFLGYLVVRWLRSQRAMDPHTWILSAGAVGLAVGGSFGLPVLTANRSSVLLWMVLLLAPLTSPSRHHPTTRASAGVAGQAYRHSNE